MLIQEHVKITATNQIPSVCVEVHREFSQTCECTRHTQRFFISLVVMEIALLKWTESTPSHLPIKLTTVLFTNVK